nr:MAG TPA: hypothetical protein [Caudoviricetes sp.]
MGTLNKIFPSEIEIAKKVVKKYYFDCFPIVSLEYARVYLNTINSDIEGFEIVDFDLYDVEAYHNPDGSTVFKGYIKVTYISNTREIYNLRY